MGLCIHTHRPLPPPALANINEITMGRREGQKTKLRLSKQIWRRLCLFAWLSDRYSSLRFADKLRKYFLSCTKPRRSGCIVVTTPSPAEYLAELQAQFPSLSRQLVASSADSRFFSSYFLSNLDSHFLANDSPRLTPKPNFRILENTIFCESDMVSDIRMIE